MVNVGNLAVKLAKRLMKTNKTGILEKMQEHYSKMEKYLKDNLPSGSGINGKWEVFFNPSKQIFTCGNTYSPMNEAGFYDGFVYFTFIIRLTGFGSNDPNDTKLVINGKKSHYYAKKYQLREYLEDTLFDWYYREEFTF